MKIFRTLPTLPHHIVYFFSYKSVYLKNIHHSPTTMNEEIEKKWREILANYEDGGRIFPHVFATKSLWNNHLSRWINKKLKRGRKMGYEWVDNYF